MTVTVNNLAMDHHIIIADIVECESNPCDNEGTCVDITDGYYCLCSHEFDGDHCEYNKDDCTPDPCVYGRCVDLVGGFSCTCDVGFTDETCGIGMFIVRTEPSHRYVNILWWQIL